MSQHQYSMETNKMSERIEKKKLILLRSKCKHLRLADFYWFIEYLDVKNMSNYTLLVSLNFLTVSSLWVLGIFQTLLSIMTFSITIKNVTFRITTFSIMVVMLNVTNNPFILSVVMLNVENNLIMVSVVMLNVIMLYVIMLNVIMLNVIMLNVIMLNVVAPCELL